MSTIIIVLSTIIIVLMVIVYVAMTLVTYTAACADWEWYGHHRWPNIHDQYLARLETVFCAIFALMPVATWIAVFAITGAYQHGFRWYVRPAFIAKENGR